MVTFIPPYYGQEIPSEAEKNMFDTLQDLDLKNAYIMHSLGLPKHKTKIYGEIDFVVICDRGIACLEIKGGKVELKQGVWIFTNRYGVENTKSEDPYAQVKGNMFSLKKLLQDRFPDNKHINYILTASGVMFPDIRFTSRSEEIIPEVTYDITTGDITAYMNRVFDYWQERYRETKNGHDPATLSPSDISDIVDFLRHDFTFIPLLADRLNTVEKKLIRLTSEQVAIIDALSQNEHLMIEGGAGTGKTLLAMDFAIKQADKGLKVLYLTFNKKLAHDLKPNAEGKDNIDIFNIHAMFGEYIEIDIPEKKDEQPKYYNETLPQQFSDYIASLPEDDLRNIRYDLIVFDEGQDLMRLDYLSPLDSLLNGGFEKGHWAVFYDEQQNIYNSDYANGLELMKTYHPTKFSLSVNCRNTIQIGSFSEKAGSIKTSSYLKENGEEVQRISFNGEADFKSKITRLLNKLRSEKISMADITLLTPRRYENSILGKAGIKVNYINDDKDITPDLPMFSTIHSFKGLDSKVVILCGVDNIYDSSFSRLMYIACSRARTLLYIIGSEDFWKSHEFLQSN